MTLHLPLYRVTVYDRSGAVLQPAGDAPHADQFKISSKPLAGYQPYLKLPRGRRGSLDLLTRKLDTGQLTFELVDSQLADLTAERWVTGFTGDAAGRDQFNGLRWDADVSWDDGATWSDHFDGVIQKVSTRGNRVRVTVRERNELLRKLRVFEGRPHASITYAFMGNLMPDAFTTGQSYANFKTVDPPTGASQDLTADGLEFTVVPDAEIDLGRRTVSKRLIELIAGPFDEQTVWTRPVLDRSQLRAVIKHTSGTESGNTGEYEVKSVTVFYQQINEEYVAYAQAIVCTVLLKADGTADTGHTEYLAAPANGVTVELRIVPNGPPTETNPLFIDDVHPATLRKDQLDGKFGLLASDGSPLFSVPYDSAAFGALESDDSLGVARFIVTERDKLTDWAEAKIDRAFYLGTRYDGQGRIVPIDLRLPSSLSGIATITDADLALDRALPTRDLDWDNRVSRVDAHYHREFVLNYFLSNFFNAVLSAIRPNYVRDQRRELSLWELDDATLGFEDPETLETDGYRAAPGEMYQGIARDQHMLRAVRQLAEWFRSPFCRGSIEVVLALRRTANTETWAVGELRLVQSAYLPDPATNVRGGTRLVRLTDVIEDGPVILATAFELGNTVAAQPGISSLVKHPNRSSSSVQVGVTVNAQSEPAVVHFAVTSTAVGTRPADDSPLWRYGARTMVDATLTIFWLPAGQRVWVRARTEPGDNVNPKLPSPWYYDATHDYVDLDGISAPTGLAVPAATKTDIAAKLTWVVGDAMKYVRVYLDGALQDTLRPGSTVFWFTELVASTAYTAGVEHWDPDSGGVSSLTTLGFTTASSGAFTPPDLLGIVVLQGEGTDVPLPVLPDQRVVETGIEIGVTPANLALGVEWRRAPDSAGSPNVGSAAVIRDTPAGVWKIRDQLPWDATRYHYSARHKGPGFGDGNWSSWVSATPTRLRDEGRSKIFDRTSRELGTIFKTDGLLRQTVLQTDGSGPRPLVKGLVKGSARNGDAVTFPTAFQNTPNVRVPFNRGILHEPRAKWGATGDGTETGAYSASLPTYHDDAALDVTASGFTVRARLRQKAAITAREDDFPAGNVLTITGTLVAEATVSNAPSNDDQYSIHYRVDIENNDEWIAAVITVTVAVDSWDGSSWTERAVRYYTLEGSGTDAWPHQIVTVAVSGLTATDKFRVRFKALTIEGGLPADYVAEIHAFNKVTDLDPTAGVTYNTSSDSFASRTPDAEDAIEWETVAL